MGDPNAQLDPTTQKALIDFAKKRLGLFGALHFKNQVMSCSCQPCQTVKAMIAGADIPPDQTSFHFGPIVEPVWAGWPPDVVPPYWTFPPETAPKLNSKTLRLGKYLGAALPPPPAKVYREYKIPAGAWEMFGNDTIGDCTCACIAHMLMLVSSHTGTMVVPTQQEVIQVYSAVSGYDPATGANDNGAAITDVLAYWQKNGIAGHKILGWAQVDQTNLTEVRQAIWLFGGLDVGITVYQSMQQQFAAGQPWDAPTSLVRRFCNKVLGGHSVPLFGYGADGTTCVTWAALQQMGWSWFGKICNEAYAVISPEWLSQTTLLTPSGFDLATLQKDLASL